MDAAVTAHFGLEALIFFALLAVAVAFLTIHRPTYGLAVLVACDAFDWSHAIGPTTVTTTKVALVGALVGLVVRRESLAVLRDRRLWPVMGGALAIVAVTFATIVPATYAEAVVRETLKASEYLALFAVAAVAAYAQTERDEMFLWRTIFGATVVVCALALMQEVHGATSGLYVGTRAIARIAGPLEGPNQLAGFLELVVPLAFARALARRHDRLAWATFAIAVLAVVLTLSRAGVFGLVVGLVVVVALPPHTWAIGRRGIAIATAVLVALAAVVNRLGVGSRFASVGETARDNGLATRPQLWAAARALWSHDPGLGVGAGNFELLLPSVGLVGVRTHANSLYLQSLAEGGIALVAAVVWTLFAAVALCVRYAPRNTFVLGVAAATCAFAAHQIFDDLFFFPKVSGLWWLFLGTASGRIAALPDEQT